jgi:hypothetical protein
MSDNPDPAAVPTFRLIYRSHSRIAPDQRRCELGAIFTTARRNNRDLGVTGALVISEDSFVQALEGDESVVRDLYGRISEDARHEHVSVVDERLADSRVFARWAMAKVAEDDGPDIRLLSNADRGTIVVAPRADPSITPEQEAVLGLMRKSIALDALET